MRAADPEAAGFRKTCFGGARAMSGQSRIEDEERLYPRPAIAWFACVVLFLGSTLAFMDRGIISLFVVHVGFGLAHSYQDLTGVIDEGLMGLLLGIIYLRTDRNLSVPIIAHGVQDSIDFILMFLGKYPYM